MGWVGGNPGNVELRNQCAGPAMELKWILDLDLGLDFGPFHMQPGVLLWYGGICTLICYRHRICPLLTLRLLLSLPGISNSFSH